MLQTLTWIVAFQAIAVALPAQVFSQTHASYQAPAGSQILAQNPIFAANQAATPASSQSPAFDHTHADWGVVLKAYVNQAGLVNYGQLSQDLAAQKGAGAKFQSYLDSLEAIADSSLNSWPVNAQKAFLINAYNAFTLALIIKHYDGGKLKSIKDIGSFFRPTWKIDFLKLLPVHTNDQSKSGTSYKITNLDTIEHDYLRPRYNDYRIHAAINCASISCPQLRQEPYEAAKLDEQLQAQVRQWLADPSRNKYEAQTGQLMLSRIFDWFADDFGDEAGIKKVIQIYGPPAAQLALAKGGKITYLDYDWSLNKQN